VKLGSKRELLDMMVDEGAEEGIISRLREIGKNGK
jgi:hypothetical protein